jgi:hypothetical protein
MTSSKHMAHDAICNVEVLSDLAVGGSKQKAGNFGALSAAMDYAMRHD